MAVVVKRTSSTNTGCITLCLPVANRLQKLSGGGLPTKSSLPFVKKVHTPSTLLTCNVSGWSIFLLDFRVTKLYNCYGLQKRGDDVVAKKIGRPTDNPKSNPVHVRLDAESNEILKLYCVQENVAKTEAIRRGIKKLKDDIK